MNAPKVVDLEASHVADLRVDPFSRSLPMAPLDRTHLLLEGSDNHRLIVKPNLECLCALLRLLHPLPRPRQVLQGALLLSSQVTERHGPLVRLLQRDLACTLDLELLHLLL